MGFKVTKNAKPLPWHILEQVFYKLLVAILKNYKALKQKYVLVGDFEEACPYFTLISV